MILPIDIVPNTSPPRFKWRQFIDTVVGRTSVNHEGTLPPALENAVASLIGLARRQAREIAEVREANAQLVKKMAERMTEGYDHGELETTEQPPTQEQSPTPPSMPQYTSSRKGRGNR